MVTNMLLIIENVVIALIGMALSFPMNSLIQMFCDEENNVKTNWKANMKFNSKLALITPIIFVLLFYFFGFSEKFIVYSFLSVILIMDMFTDIKSQIIPNDLNMVGFIFGLIYVYYNLLKEPKVGLDLLFGMFIGAGIFLLIALFALVVYRKEGMGLGDVKLMGVLGLFLGARNIFQIFILSFVIGAIVSIILLITKIKKMDEYIPFGPFIVIATFITMFIPYSSMIAFWNRL